MDTAHWQRLSPVLDRLLDMTSLQRKRQLHLIRQSQASLADEISALLALDQDIDGLWPPALHKAPKMLHPGTRVGPYCLEGCIGEGGMSMVWSARHTDSRRRVALKLTHPDLPDDHARLHLGRERDILIRLKHPHITRMLDADIYTTGQPYLALEYVDGIAITEYCRQRAVTIATRLRLFNQVCQAVSYAHAHSVVHGDLKPSNILVTISGQTRLLDFGIARRLDLNNSQITRTEPHAFTSYYAAPEQVLGEPITVRSDVFSLGTVLFDVLTGRKLSHLRTDALLAWEQASTARDVLGADFDYLMRKALAKRPEHRYATVDALCKDLQRYLNALPTGKQKQHLDDSYSSSPLHPHQ